MFRRNPQWPEVARASFRCEQCLARERDRRSRLKGGSKDTHPRAPSSGDIHSSSGTPIPNVTQYRWRNAVGSFLTRRAQLRGVSRGHRPSCPFGHEPHANMLTWPFSPVASPKPPVGPGRETSRLPVFEYRGKELATDPRSGPRPRAPWVIQTESIPACPLEQSGPSSPQVQCNPLT